MANLPFHDYFAAQGLIPADVPEKMALANSTFEKRSAAAVPDVPATPPADTLRKLYIEPTSNCNLNCSMCFRNTWVDEEFADMPWQVFRRTLATMPESVETILFGGMGEPLSHPELIPMVREAAATGKRIEMVTNVALLTPERSEQLIEVGLDRLWVSIDAFNEEGYNAIRRKGNFSVVRTHLNAFNRIKANLRAKTSLGINFVAMKTNIGQLQHIPFFVQSFNVDEVNVSNLIPSDRESEDLVLYQGVVGVDQMQSKQEATPINLPLMNWREKGVLEGIMSLLSSHAGVVRLGGQVLFRKYNHCRFIDEGNAFVRHDGNVAPCMGLLHSATTYWMGMQRIVRHHSFGNVLDERLDEIWRSAPYVRFRDRVRTFDFSPCMRCSGCDNWEENSTDCFGNEKPVCGACIWAEGVVSCP